jgi:hypothetical protein
MLAPVNYRLLRQSECLIVVAVRNISCHKRFYIFFHTAHKKFQESTLHRSYTEETGCRKLVVCSKFHENICLLISTEKK